MTTLARFAQVRDAAAAEVGMGRVLAHVCPKVPAAAALGEAQGLGLCLGLTLGDLMHMHL